MIITSRANQDRRHDNPAASDITAIYSTKDGAAPDPSERTMHVHRRDGYLIHINATNPTADPLTYPLLLPFGQHEGHQEANGQQDIAHDEIRQYRNSRYVGPHRAVYKLMQYEMYDKSHTITRLPIHLPDQQNVCFTDPQQAAHRNNDSMLTAFFNLNQTDPNAHQLLLLYRTGVTSFEDIRTVDGITHDTFKNAAKAMSLLDNDAEHRRCLTEASVINMPAQMRRLFATLILFQTPSDTHALFTELIQTSLQIHGKSLSDFPEMPQLPANYAQPLQPAEEINIEQEREQGQQMFEQLNSEQLQMHNTIVQAIETQSPDN
eukprot:gene1078-biopygen302